MIAQSDEQIKEERRATVIHLKLHRSAALEGAARADDQGEIVRPQLRVVVRRVGIGIPGRRQDGAALNAGFCGSSELRASSWKTTQLTKTLLSQRQLLQLTEAILLSSAVDDRVLEQITIDAAMIHRALDGAPLIVGRLLQLPGVATLVLHEAREVVALVEILQDRAEDLGFLIRQRNPLGGRVGVCVS